MASAPLFLIGTGRCGSTILHRVLSHHPHLAWPTATCNRQPRKLDYNRRIMNALELPVIGDLAWRKEQIGEVYGFWNHHFRGFSTPFRDLVAGDVDQRTRHALVETFEQLKTNSRTTVMMKITGFPRIGFLKEIWPDAKFIHLVRDGRPTALSDMAMPWCDVWKGIDRWNWGPLSDEQRATWTASGESFHVLAVLLWEKLIKNVWQVSADLDEQHYLELRYEDLCAEPKTTMDKILSFADLEWHPSFERKFATYDLRATNDKWRKQVTDAQAELMTRAVESTLQHYNYEI